MEYHKCLTGSQDGCSLYRQMNSASSGIEGRVALFVQVMGIKSANNLCTSQMLFKLSRHPSLKEARMCNNHVEGANDV